MRKYLGRRPAPSLVISIVALAVAMTGSAGAAYRLVIKSSKQIRDHTIQAVDLAPGTLPPSTTAQEAFRKAGPEHQPAGAHTVATLSQLGPGTYLLLAKTIMTTDLTDQGILGELLKTDKTIAGHCILSAGGDQDDARAPIATPYTETPSTMNMQLTRTIDTPTDIAVVCDSNYAWRASDTSIVALKLADSVRNAVDG
jgi:hypothetical protein